MFTATAEKIALYRHLQSPPLLHPQESLRHDSKYCSRSHKYEVYQFFVLRFAILSGWHHCPNPNANSMFWRRRIKERSATRTRARVLPDLHRSSLHHRDDVCRIVKGSYLTRVYEKKAIDCKYMGTLRENASGSTNAWHSKGDFLIHLHENRAQSGLSGLGKQGWIGSSSEMGQEINTFQLSPNT